MAFGRGKDEWVGGDRQRNEPPRWGQASAKRYVIEIRCDVFF